jgi:hypothetical protein
LIIFTPISTGGGGIPVKINVTAPFPIATLKALFGGGGAENLFPVALSVAARYDVVIKLNRYPQVVAAPDLPPLAKAHFRLSALLKAYLDFQRENSGFFASSSSGDAAFIYYARLRGQNRLQYPDTEKILNIAAADYRSRLPIFIDEAATLEKFNLRGKKFITLARGAGAFGELGTFDCTKEYPLAHYDELTARLKRQYPAYALVQIGMARNAAMQNIDVDLRGQTTLEELKVLLKNSVLHLDGEGGNAHLRRYVGGGKAVILFGPTAPEDFGYAGNINIRADAVCPLACEWLTRWWMKKCPRGFAAPPCMNEISPALVMEKISESGGL